MMADAASQTSKRFTRLMRLGHVAYADGKHQQAHQLWRQAAMLQPDSEQVWLALLNVVDDDNDKRVCVRNILAINPDNDHVHEALASHDDTATSDEDNDDTERVPNWRKLFYLLEAACIGGLVAVGIVGIQFITMN